MSTLEAIRASRPRVVPVLLPSGGTVHVKSLSGTQRHVIASSKESQSDVAIATLGLCEADGRRTFERPEEGLGLVGEMDGADVATIAQAVLRASSLIKEEGPNPLTASPS